MHALFAVQMLFTVKTFPRNFGLSVVVCVQGDIADEEFSQYFSQFGEIEDCVVS